MERFEENCLKKKHHIAFTVSRLWAKNIRTFGKCFQQASQNCLQILQGSVLSLSWRNLDAPYHFRSMNIKKQIHIWRKAFGRIVERLRVLRNILGRNYFFEKTKNVFFDYHILSKFCSDFWRKQSSSVVRAAVYVYRGTFWWFFFVK